jgi:1-phosphatidylinositol phosphodiesterase
MPYNVIPINPNEAEQYSLSLEAHLFDYDQNSGNDLLGNSGSTLQFMEAFDAPKEVVLNFNGEGKVKIAATLTRTASTGFKKIDETLITGDAYSAEEDPAPWIYTATKNWMGALPDNVSIKDVSIPGTHDAGSRFGGAAAETQTWTITEQLNSGIRYLDIRCRGVGNKFTIHHGSFYQNQNFDDVTTEVKNFLSNNPKEVVVMRIKKETDSAAGSSTYSEIWNGYLNNYPNLFYSSNNSNASLGEVRGKIFVLCQIPSICSYNGINFSTIDVQDKYDVRWLAHEEEGEVYATLPSKKKLINNYIDKAAYATGWMINHLSGSTGMIPSDVARATNRSAYEYLGNKTSKRKLGILSMDFPGEQLIYRIIKSNFD